MTRYRWRLALGVLLIAGGILFLLGNLGVWANLVGLLWLVCFGAAGLGFLLAYLADRERWWALIPGFLLLGLAASGAVARVFPWMPDGAEGALFLGTFGFGFVAVYLTGHDRWWAIIPGGVLCTAGLANGFSSVFRAGDTGGLVLVGLGLTFVVLSVVPTPQGRLRWAIIPGIVLLVAGLVVSLASASVLKYVWAGALIAVGIYVVARALLPGSMSRS